MKKFFALVLTVISVVVFSAGCNSDIDIGKIAEKKLKNNDVVNCEIIALCSANDLSYEIEETEITDEEVVVDAVVYKCGSTTYLTKGKIIDTDYSFSYSDYPDVKFSHFIRATYDSDGGDSDGLVFTIHNSEKGTFDVAGIHGGSGNYALFTSFERYDEYVMEKTGGLGFYQY